MSDETVEEILKRQRYADTLGRLDAASDAEIIAFINAAGGRDEATNRLVEHAFDKLDLSSQDIEELKRKRNLKLATEDATDLWGKAPQVADKKGEVRAPRRFDKPSVVPPIPGADTELSSVKSTVEGHPRSSPMVRDAADDFTRAFESYRKQGLSEDGIMEALRRDIAVMTNQAEAYAKAGIPKELGTNKLAKVLPFAKKGLKFLGPIALGLGTAMDAQATVAPLERYLESADEGREKKLVGDLMEALTGVAPEDISDLWKEGKSQLAQRDYRTMAGRAGMLQ